MRHWRADALTKSPQRTSILLAVEEHDNGWAEVDARPLVDSATGRILDFINAPGEVRRGVWPRGVERLAGTPYAAALVAQHALHIYRRYREDPEWVPFFVDMQCLRDSHLQASSDATLEELLSDYEFVRLGDLASLTFCNGWTDVQTDVPGYSIWLDNERLLIAPDPFEGHHVEFEIAARELPECSFESTSDAWQAFVKARRVMLTGVVSGKRGRV